MGRSKIFGNFVILLGFRLDNRVDNTLKHYSFFKVGNLGTSSDFGTNDRIEISKISGSGGALSLNVKEGKLSAMELKN